MHRHIRWHIALPPRCRCLHRVLNRRCGLGLCIHSIVLYLKHLREAAARSGAARTRHSHGSAGQRARHRQAGQGTAPTYRVAARSRPRSGGLCRLLRALPPLLLGGAALRHRRPRLRTLQRSLPPSAPRGRGLHSVLWQVSRRSSRGVSAGFVVAHLLRVGACTAHRPGAAPSAPLPALAPVALREPAP